MSANPFQPSHPRIAPSTTGACKPTASKQKVMPLTAEELILEMNADELEELLFNLGFESRPELARGIQRLVAELGTLDAAIVALQDDQVARRAA